MFENRLLLWKGFRFGMFLQLAVGPVCLMVLNTSATYGFGAGLPLIAAIVCVDAAYIALSAAGIAAVMDRPCIRSVSGVLGCLILIAFGANMAIEAFEPSLQTTMLSAAPTDKDWFARGLLLTASNPLTIVFWGGVFATEAAKNSWNQKQLFLFGTGCVVSTLFFLTLISLLGNFLGEFSSPSFLRTLNLLVGISLIFFGLRLVFAPFLHKLRKTPVP